jgi:hypothetical protein
MRPERLPSIGQSVYRAQWFATLTPILLSTGGAMGIVFSPLPKAKGTPPHTDTLSFRLGQNSASGAFPTVKIQFLEHFFSQN